MRAILFFANGTEEVEALTTLDYLRRTGTQVVLAGVGGREVTGAHGIKITADISADEFNPDETVDAVILPGGMPGTLYLENSDVVRKTVLNAYNGNKIVAAICAAPSVLGKMGLLKGKKATCYPGFEGYLEGAEYVKEKAVTDGNIVTGAGAGAANEFAFAVIAALYGSKAAEDLKKSVMYL